MTTQNYEEYWKLTNAFTDYNGKKFLDTLKTSIYYNGIRIFSGLRRNATYQNSMIMKNF